MNDADRLGLDPVMRWIVGGHAVAEQAASASQMGRFETEVLATEENLAALADLSGHLIDSVHDRRWPKMIILDMDSARPTATRWAQPTTDMSAAPATIPLDPLRGSSLFNQFGDLERCSLRPGNVHSADDWESVLKPVVVRYKWRKVQLYFRGDAAIRLQLHPLAYNLASFMRMLALPKEVEHWSLTTLRA